MKRKSTSPCLLAIPAFDRIAGLSNSQLNSNGGLCFNFYLKRNGIPSSAHFVVP